MKEDERRGCEGNCAGAVSKMNCVSNELRENRVVKGRLSLRCAFRGGLAVFYSVSWSTQCSLLVPVYEKSSFRH